MVYITLANGDAYSEEVLSQKQKTYDNVSVPYKRGDIKDRNGSVLATSVKVYNLVLEPKNVLADENIKYKQKTVDALVKYFGVTEEEVNKALEDSESWYKVLKKQIPYGNNHPYKRWDIFSPLRKSTKLQYLQNNPEKAFQIFFRPFRHEQA